MRLSPKHKLALGLAVAGLVVAIGFFLLLGTVFVWGESAPATIVGERKSSQGSCAPIVEYQHAGKKLRSETRVFTPCGASPGESVTVYFWPEKPDDAWVFDFSRLFVPVLIPLALFAAAIAVARSKPKMKDILATTPLVAVAEARPGQLVKVRGALELSGPAIAAPLTGRSAVMSWSRVARRVAKQPDAGVQDEVRFAPFVLRDSSGALRVEAGTPLRIRVTAESHGSTEHERSLAVESFLKSHGHSAEGADSATQHFVWYEAVFSEGEVVFVVGVPTAEGSLVAPQAGTLIVSRD